jgi:NAD+ kinase
VLEVEVRETRAISQVVLFDPEHKLEERILKEQFET